MAEVTLVTDKDHAVPVKVQRSGVRSVLYGAGAGHAPELRFMAPSTDIQVGDVLVTSGLDGTYPAGLAVARVATLERETGQMFARITCAPLAGVDRSEHLLVLRQSAAAMPRPEEPAEAEAAKKIGKGKRRSAGAP
jgi:rod shape-determining protein MreC